MTAYEDELEELEPEEDETALLELEDEEETPGRWQMVWAMATDITTSHPRLSCGGGSLAISIAIDVVVHFDPFVSILGLVSAAVIGWKGEDVLQLFAPSADPEEAHRVVSQVFDYPTYRDQSVQAKIMRLFRQGPDSLYELAEPEEEEQQPVRQVRPLPPLQRTGEVKRLPPGNTAGAGQGLTHERIIAWFERGTIDDQQLVRLLDHIEKRSQTVTRNGRNAQPKTAPEDAVSPQNANDTPVTLPPGWVEKHLLALPYLYEIENNIDTCLKGMKLSTSQDNRRFAREILKQQGLIEK